MHHFSIVEKVKNLEAEDISKFRIRLMSTEGHFSDRHFEQILGLIPESVRPDRRRTFKACDGINNIFNLSYELLSWKVRHALIKAELEPYLGFLHSIAKGRPSLVCDFQELYRYLIDDFLIERRKRFHKNDFVVVTDFMMKLRMGKRIHLCDYETDELAEGLNQFFDKKVEIPRVKYGYKQTLDTLISEEAFLLASYLRNEKGTWIPRLPSLSP